MNTLVMPAASKYFLKPCSWAKNSTSNQRGKALKRPALRAKQGMWTLFGEAGLVLKRGHELAGVLAVLERKLLKIVED